MTAAGVEAAGRVGQLIQRRPPPSGSCAVNIIFAIRCGQVWQHAASGTFVADRPLWPGTGSSDMPQ